MKLAKVEHLRCHGRGMDDPVTYVWVFDAMTGEQFQDFVTKAQIAYDKAGTDFEAAERPPYAQWGMPDYSKHPDKTVAEVKAAHEAAQELYNAWKKRKETAQQDFGYHLEAVGGGSILRFWKQSPAFSVDLDWGHRHGKNVAYGETEMNDLGGTVEREDWP